MGAGSKKAAAYSSRSAVPESAFSQEAGTDDKPFSCIAAAAYASRTRAYEKRYMAKPQDYRHKRDLVWSSILAPDHVPAWVYDRKKLWTKVEEHEDISNRSKTAQLFRGTVIALPRELTIEQQIELLKDYTLNEYVSEGMIVDINIHDSLASDGGRNPHAHVMLTMWGIGPDGFGNKRRDWNDVDFGIKGGDKHHRPFALTNGFVRQRKQSWVEHCNEALAAAGSSARIDHRTLEAQRINRKPQPKMGKAGHARRGPEWVEKKHASLLDVWVHNHAVRVGVSVGRAMLGGTTLQRSPVAARSAPRPSGPGCRQAITGRRR